MIRAFTGPSKMSETQLLWAAGRIVRTRSAVWRSGCAPGLDTLAAKLAYALDADLELYVPFAAHNETLVRDLAPRASRVIRCPKGRTVAESYRIRNAWMVEGQAIIAHTEAPRADILHAFVRQEEFYRSGECMTINIARRAGVFVVKEVLPEAERTANQGHG